MSDTDATYLGFTAIFGFMDPKNKCMETVVQRAIDSRRKVSTDARRLLNSAIREYIKVDGYKNTDRAPSHYLQEPVLEAITKSVRYTTKNKRPVQIVQRS